MRLRPDPGRLAIARLAEKGSIGPIRQSARCARQPLNVQTSAWRCGSPRAFLTVWTADEGHLSPSDTQQPDGRSTTESCRTCGRCARRVCANNRRDRSHPPTRTLDRITQRRPFWSSCRVPSRRLPIGAGRCRARSVPCPGTACGSRRSGRAPLPPAETVGRAWR